MAIYTIHSRELDAIGDARFLRDGFSWGAFWLGPIWLLWHGLYASCAAWIGVVVVAALAIRAGLSPDAGTGVFVAIQALLGLEADHLLQRKLTRTGYRLVDIVAAPNLDEAEAAFFRRHGPANGASLPGPEAGP